MTARVIKCWAAWVRGYGDEPGHYYAPTRGAARWRVIQALDVHRKEVAYTMKFITVRRAPERDIVLPEPHRIVAELTEADREIILNAHGYGCHLDPSKWGFRDHFCTHASDTKLHRLAWELGLFNGPFGEGPYGQSPGWAGVFYYLNDFGKEVSRSMWQPNGSRS